MSIAAQKAFDDILKMTQMLVTRASAKSGGLVTADLISAELNKAELMLPDEFALVDRDALIDELIRRSSQSVGRNATLSSSEDHIAWLNAARKQDWRYWRRYSEYMDAKLPWKALDALDQATDDVLQQLEDPLRTGVWDRRGLVVGHVQSGKTGNYTGLICKAADAGYKIIIVLAGLHNNLRSQTQIRLDEGFLGFATIANVDTLPRVGVGEIDMDHSINPNYGTTRGERGDFTKGQIASLGVSPEQRPWLFVVKKNKTVLERLLLWIRSRVANEVDPLTGRKLVTNLPLLVIDDEADHGSVDTGEDVVDENGVPDEEHKPTTINRLIRAILHQFTRKAYVGYTATPFANIFIHDKGTTAEHGPDLFPAAFITNLAAPSNYIGPGRVFGSASASVGDLPLTRPLADDDFTQWMPPKHKSHHRPAWQGESRLPDTAQEAIRSFLYACAIRHLRGQGGKHCSMLIHVTRFVAVQNAVTVQVEDYVRLLKGRLVRGIDPAETEALMAREYETTFRPGMAKIRDTLAKDEVLADFSWDQVRAVLPEILDDIRVKEINGSAKDALDYVDHEGTGLKVIAVGGDKLARGLTLEGLCTSYFLRCAKMYDTLMQMGRWFGYRDGYLDVCRLYTSNEMIEWFGHIADASEELREEFDNMEAAGATPKEFGLRVRSHSVLTVTSRSKMRNARPMELTFAGNLLQTIVFGLADVKANFLAGDRFVSSLGVGRELNEQLTFLPNQTWSGRFWEGVPAAEVTAFLRSYKTHPSSFRIMSPLIADFIDVMTKTQELTEWTVALIGKEKAEEDRLVKIGGQDTVMLKRKRNIADDKRYSIKTLTSPRDQTIGLTEAEWNAALAITQATWRNDKERNQGDEVPKEPRGPAIRKVLGEGVPEAGVPHRCQRGLLMLYLLDPAKDKSEMETLDPDVPVLGWAINFPGSKSDTRVSNEKYMANSVLWSTVSEGKDWGAVNDGLD
ncbi:Z1 domain-containing protein [Rhodobacter sp. KR11]|uniref:Z1 domain-containing protein n=1 Tax=Rhodobacter sp. KR11 TaxID=2974588 RepID=UPI0022230A5D|nr:Z1 domain-containing protein [Rhodobacter sp. KR11]MCW1918031.1 Z1 domain-containing protein [Rhodobacter sp. KR11]